MIYFYIFILLSCKLSFWNFVFWIIIFKLTTFGIIYCFPSNVQTLFNYLLFFDLLFIMCFKGGGGVGIDKVLILWGFFNVIYLSWIMIKIYIKINIQNLLAINIIAKLLCLTSFVKTFSLKQNLFYILVYGLWVLWKNNEKKSLNFWLFLSFCLYFFLFSFLNIETIFILIISFYLMSFYLLINNNNIFSLLTIVGFPPSALSICWISLFIILLEKYGFVIIFISWVIYINIIWTGKQWFFS